MKKIFLLATLGLVSAVTVNATDFTVDGITYTTASTGTNVTVKGSEEFSDGVLQIPAYVTHEGTKYTVTEIGKEAFNGKRWIKQLSIPSTITKVRQSAFANCTYIETPIVLPEGLTIIEQSGFESCMSIPSVTLPESVTTIGSYAFRRCYELTSFKIGPKVTSLGTGVISNNSKVARVEVDPANPNYASQAGLVYNKALTTLVIVPAATESVTIPETVTKFADYSFSSCTNLKTLVVPNSVTSIGYACFEDCDHLENITLSTSMKTLGKCTFYKNYALKNIVIPDNFEVLDDWCFFLLSGLEKIKVGKGVKTMKGCPFTLCDNIKLLEIGSDVPPTCEKDPVSATVLENATLVVPAGKVDVYKATSPWSKFKTIKEASDYGVTLKVEPYVPGRLKLANDMKIRFNVFNEGSDQVANVDYTLVTDGATTTGTISSLAIPGYSTGKVEIPVSLTLGHHAGSLTIDKVNGQANTNAVKSTDWSLDVVESVEIPEDALMASWAHNVDKDHYGQSALVATYEGAQRFKDPSLVGYKVVGMKIDDVEGTYMKNFRVWYSTKLGEHNGEEAEANYEDGTVKGAFCNPVTLTDDGIVFGFTMDRAANQGSGYVIPGSRGEDKMAGALYAKLGDEGYEDWSDQAYLPLTLYVQGPSQPNTIKLVKLNSLPSVAMNTEFKLPFVVQNYGGNSVQNVELTYTINGEEHVVTTKMQPWIDQVMCRTQIAKIGFDAIPEGGNYDISLAITKVNGQPNSLSSIKLDVPLTVSTFQTKHLPFLEEGTGTGCGWCTRGTMGLAEMGKRDPEFIGAAWHTYNDSDPMYSSIKTPFVISGFPGCQIDRSGKYTDPYFGDNHLSMGIQDLYNAAKEELAPANISVESQWDANMSKLTVNTTCKFAYTEANRSYKLGYVLTIDGLSHPDMKAWEQNNSYRNGSDDPLLDNLCTGGSFDITTYNHVVFDASCATGCDDLSSITLGQDIAKSHTFVIADNTLADKEMILDEDLSKVNVIAFILDDQGHIRNAVKAKAGEAATTGIVAPAVEEVENLPVVYYDLMGRRIDNPSHGNLYIRQQGSKVTKIMM